MKSYVSDSFSTRVRLMQPSGKATDWQSEVPIFVFNSKIVESISNKDIEQT